MPTKYDGLEEVDDDFEGLAAVGRDQEQGAIPVEADQGIMGSLQQSFDETLENPMDTAMDAMQGVHQGASLGHSDELASTAAGMYEVATGADFETAKIAADNIKQKIRNRVNLARERSPIAYYGAEIATPNPLDFAGIGKAGKIAERAPKGLKTLADMTEWGGAKATDLLRSGTVQGGIAAAGYSDDETDATDILLGTGAGLVGDIARKGIGSVVAKRPREVRQRNYGAGKSAFQERGIHEREALDKFLEEFGFHNRGKKYLSLDNNLKIRPSKRVVGKNARPSEISLENAERLISKAHTKAENKLYQVSDGAPSYDFDTFSQMPEMRDAMHSIQMKMAGDLDTTNAFNKAISEMSQTFENTGIDGQLSLVDLNNVKRFLQNKGANSMSTAGTETAATKVYAQLQGPINDIIQREANKVSAGAGDYIRRANDIQSALITQSKDLLGRVGGQRASEMSLPFLSKSGAVTAGAKEVVSAPLMADTRVALGMFRQNNPATASLVREAVKSAPRKLMGGMMQEDNPNDIVGQLNSIPKMLAKQPIPRDSREILKNKEFVVAKISMAAPQMLPYVKHVLYEEPEKLDDILPMLVEMAPNMFENDVYNRINGKIMNPVDRERAQKDNREDESLSNTEKAERANSIALKGMV